MAHEVPRAERTKVKVKMIKIVISLSMLVTAFSPFLALADVPRPMQLDDLGVSTLLLAYWAVLAFATGMSIVLWKFRSRIDAVIVSVVVISGVLGVVTFGEGGMFAEIGWLFFRCGIPVAVAMFAVFALINKVYRGRWKRGLMFLPLVVMTVCCLFGFRLLFAECRTCESKGVIRWYDMGHRCAECNCCKGMRCHFRWGHVRCVAPIIMPRDASLLPVSEEPTMDSASHSASKRFVQQESASDSK